MNKLNKQQIKNGLKFSIQQIFAESYFENYWNRKKEFLTQSNGNLTSGQQDILKDLAKTALLRGNSDKEPYIVQNGQVIYQGGFAKLTESLAAQAIEQYDIVDYKPNEAAGFSAVLLKDNMTGEYTLSFRSTEYFMDFFRDAHGADDEIKNTGFSYGQISEMQKYYEHLKTSVLPTGTKLNLTGYSLGGHLAYAFSVLNPNDINHVYTQNAAGIGMIGSDNRNLPYYQEQLTSALSKFDNLKDNFFNELFENSNVLSVQESQYVKDNLNNVLNSIGVSNSAGNPATNIANGQPLSNIVDKMITVMNKYTSTSTLLYPLNVTQAFKEAIKLSINNNPYPSGTLGNTTIYNDPRYQLSVRITTKEYNTRGISVSDALVGSISGGDGGAVVNDIFDPQKFTVLSGKAASSEELVFNDPNFVSKSNLHPAFNDIFIEDQPELIGKGGKLPGVLYNLTKNRDGDLGNTHSITALIDSLKAIETLQTLFPTLTSVMAESVLDSSSNQYAKRKVSLTSNSVTESNSISNLINSLTRILINPLKEDTKFTRLSTSLGEVLERNEIHNQEQALMNLVNTNYTMVSFYNSTLAPNQQIISAQEIITKAKQNNEEGLAYRYALREMNNFVLLGADYSTLNINGELNINSHSDLWYKARADILVENIKNNILNNDIYSGENIGHGKIKDDVAFRHLNYSQEYNSDALPSPFFAQDFFVQDYIDNFMQNTEKFKNKTTFTNDAYQPYYISNLNNQVINTQSYNDTKYNDFIFMGNKVNSILLTGGNDTIETGKQNNFINANSVTTKSSLTLALYGNNTINLSGSYYGGQISYKNKELTGGVVQSDGSYVDYNYSNVTYKFKYEGRNILEIKYLNEDNTVNTTTIDNYNPTSNLFGLNFNQSPVLNANRTLIDLEYTSQNNPYIDSNATLIQRSIIGYNGSTPIYQQYVTGLFSAAYPTMVLQQSGDYIHSYNVENNTSMKAHISDVSPEILQELNPKNISLYESYNIVYFRPQDKIMIPANMHFLGSSISRLGDDLIVLNNTGNVAPITLKNYFKFNHQNETNLWFMDENKNPVSQLSTADILKYDTLSATNDNDIVNAGSFSTVIDTLGDDNYTSGTQNTTFIDIPYGMHKQSNDIYNSGTGNNRFIFGTAYGSGNDIINNIKSTDKIILFKDYPFSSLPLPNSVLESYSTASLQTILTDLKVQLVKEGNDLIIRNNNTGINFSLLVKDYYLAFQTPSQNSGIYIEDVYGKSHLLDISEFENFENTNKTLNPNSKESYTIENNSSIKKLNTNGASSDVIVKKSEVDIDVDRGTTCTIGLQIDSPSANGDKGTTVTVDGANNPQDINEVTIIQVTGFDREVDIISFKNTNISNTVMTQEGNDLYIRIFVNNNITTMALVKDYFLVQSNNTGIEIYNGVKTPPISIGSLGSMIEAANINSNQDMAYIDASSINKNTNIVSTGNFATIAGSKFNDNITAGHEADRFIMSTGVDTYHLTKTSGIDELMFNKEALMKGAYIIIQYDNSVTAQDIKMYYDKYDEVFTIKVNNDNGLIITNIDQNAAYSIEQFMEIKLANGTNILKQTYQIESGAPFTYEGIPNKVLLGTSGNDVLDGYVKNHDAKNYLVFGGDGNDEITGNFNTMKNGDYKASLLVGGKGNDEIYAGNYDIVMARKGDGADTIYYDNNHEDFILNVFKENTTPNAFGVKTVGNSLEIYYANNTTDKMILDNYWNLVKDNLHIAVNDMGSNNSSHLRAYSINEVMEELGLNKNNMGNNIHVVEYEDIKNLIARESTDKLIGGELAGYYAELGSFTGFSAGGAVDILNKFDNELLMPKSGMNDPSDFRKL